MLLRAHLNAEHLHTSVAFKGSFKCWAFHTVVAVKGPFKSKALSHFRSYWGLFESTVFIQCICCRGSVTNKRLAHAVAVVGPFETRLLTYDLLRRIFYELIIGFSLNFRIFLRETSRRLFSRKGFVASASLAPFKHHTRNLKMILLIFKICFDTSNVWFSHVCHG